jgi:mRNA-degrading endonuclease RelE of RelBE toxin-antitoxin system
MEFYIKKRRYRNIRKDISPIIEKLEHGCLVGDEIPGINPKVGGHTYKVRAVNTDTQSGKSDGYRVVYYAIQDDKTIFLLTVYNKKDNVRIPTNNEIVGIIEQYC